MKPIIISVINHKGGVGKTTTTVNISAGLAKLGKKVLAIDLDTQMNLTHSLIEEPSDGSKTISDCLIDRNVSLKAIIRETKTHNLHIAPSGESMVSLELNLQNSVKQDERLKLALEAVEKDYDFILLDNPPHIGLTTVNSLMASDYYLVPVSTEYLPMVGIKHLLTTLERIKPYKAKLDNLGYLLTMVDRRESIATDVEKILRGTFQDEVFKNVIRINTKLKACPQKKETIFQVETSKGKGHSDYLNAAKELLERVERN